MIYHGDLFNVCPVLVTESIDACVTDPPYGIGFMGRQWDTFKPGSGKTRRLMHPRERAAAKNPNIRGRKRVPAMSPSQIEYDYSATGLRAFQKWTTSWSAEVYRLLKPGAYLLVCGAPRSYHRMACGLEDAGFEIRDMFSWLFGSGYPKSIDVARAIDMQLCTQAGRHFMRELRLEPPADVKPEDAQRWRLPGDHVCAETELGAEWAGWGSGLKPGQEPIAVARKPIEGTLSENVLRFGVGGLNVAACRLEGNGPVDKRFETHGRYCVTRQGEPSADRRYDDEGATDFAMKPGVRGGDPMGRWPSNVLLDQLAAAIVDAEAGERTSGFMAAGTRRDGLGYGGGLGTRVARDTIGDSGGVSRFFYVAKPSRAERDAGCDDLRIKTAGECTNRHEGTAGLRNPRAGAGLVGGGRNDHPTVKPIELMRWLVRLVTPPDGLVLDPFTGSGTTGMACRYEQRRFIGIEREPEYVAIAERRIAAVAPLFAESADDDLSPVSLEAQ